MLIRILDPPCKEMDADQEIFIIFLFSKVQIRVLSGFGSGSRRPKSCGYSTDSISHYIFLNGIVEMSYFMKVEGGEVPAFSFGSNLPIFRLRT